MIGAMARHRVQVLRAAGKTGGGGVGRRLIFLRIGSPEPAPARSAIFGINASRTPRFFADVDIHNLVLLFENTGLETARSEIS
jgi:hypothetical protein